MDMVIGIIGESCTGKSTLADKLKTPLNAEVYTGKDYIRLAKNEADAKTAFAAILQNAMTEGYVLYVISEPEHVPLLPEGALRVLVKADLATIEQRFAVRMNGVLPPPVQQMLARKHGCFDTGRYDVIADGASADAAEEAYAQILEMCRCN